MSTLDPTTTTTPRPRAPAPSGGRPLVSPRCADVSTAASSASSSFSSSPGPSMLLHVHSTHSDITSSDHSVSRPTLNSTYLAFPAPRSSSLPRTVPMGQPHSKSTVHPLSSSPSGSGTSQGSPKGLSFGGAAVAGGLKLKRAFARRKKPEDGPIFTPTSRKGGDLNQLDIARSTASSPAQFSSSSSHVDGARLEGRSYGHAQSPVVPTVAPALKSVQATPSLPLPPKLPLHSPPDNHGSVIPISPGISSAVDSLRRAEEQKTQERRSISQLAEKSDSAVRTEKETWRKSDSTNSHHTIRPGTTGVRASRPSSMAESLQSNHTIIPANNKRLSALVADADFGMPEEDDLVNPWDNETPVAQNASPTSSIKSRDRRSVSLHLGSQLYHKARLPSPPVTASLGEMKLLSKSISEGIPSKEVSPPMRATASTSTGHNTANHLAAPIALRALPQPPQQRKLPMPPAPSQSDKPAAPPVQSPSFRQTAISMTSGLAPAAGMAKRAVERVGRAWGLGSNTSGYSSSSSSTPPSSFIGAPQSDHNVMLTTSNHSTPSIAASSHKKKPTRTPNAPSGSWSISSSTTSGSISDSDAFMTPAGPYLGIRVRGAMRLKSGGAGVAGGIVFRRDLITVVRETAIQFDKPHEGGEQRLEESQDTPFGRKGSISRGDLRALEQRLLPALVVRCAQHLLIWGVQEEGLFRVSGRTSHIAKLRTEFDTGADYDMTGCTPGDLDPHAVASIFKAFLRELPEPILTHALLPYFEAAMNHENNSNAAEPVHNARGARGLGLPSNPRSSGLPMIRKPPSLSTLALPSFAGMRPPSKSLLNALRSLIAQLPPENRDLIRTVVELIKATAKESKLTKMPLSNLLLVFCPSLSLNPPLLRILCEGEDLWEPHSEISPVLDIKRESTVLDISAPATTASTRLSHSFTKGEEDDKSSVESDDLDGDVPESESKRRTIVQDRSSPRLRNHVSTIYLDTECYHESSGSIMADSTTSSIGYSDSASFKDDASYASTSEGNSHPRPDAPSPPLSSSAESLATPSNSSGQPSFSHLPMDKDVYSAPNPLVVEEPGSLPLARGYRHRPTISSPMLISGPIQFPSTSETLSPTLKKKRSIPLLSLPNLSAALPDLPSSPSSSSTSSRAHRLKKPSLHLLFSKRSTSSLASSTSSPKPFISSPGPYLQTPRAASDSSVSTPISAVTAPQASTFTLPPVLDTPIQSSPLHLGLGIDLDSGPPTGTKASFESGAPVEAPADPQTFPRETHIADRYHSAANSANSLGSPEPKSHLRPYLTARSRQASVSSIASSNHLGLLDDEPEEDWTQSVLLAADVDGGWAITSRQ